MTFDERLAELGVDLSDLPNGYTLDAKRARGVSDIACRWFIDEDTPDGVALRNLVSIPLFQYILHLVDVIDRMETRLVNLTGERDWLKSVLENHLFCETCVGGQGIEPCVNGHLCSTDNPNYRYSGVPEDWRVDDA